MVARLRFPCRAVRVLPGVVDVDVAVTPLGPLLVVERRALIVGACGEVGHRGLSVARMERSAMRDQPPRISQERVEDARKRALSFIRATSAIAAPARRDS